MMRSTRVTLASLALPFALALSGCGDGLDLEPNLSGPAGNTAGVTATPTPTPTPAAPTPTPTPAGLTCNLSAMPDCAGSCCFAGGANDFVGVIEEAQADLRRTRPELFNGNRIAVGDLEYTDVLAKRITQLFGICAAGGGQGSSRSNDEIGLKRDNGRSVNVDVALSNREQWVGGIYTCRPAAF